MASENKQISQQELSELAMLARQAALAAYNPYSQFAVGAALRTKSGKIFTGCNIENASYSVTICAERVAGSQAVLQGQLDWDAMVVVSPQGVSLCGVCRQFCIEFAPNMQVWTGYLASNPGECEGSSIAKHSDLRGNQDLTGPVMIHELLPSGMTLDRTSTPERKR